MKGLLYETDILSIGGTLEIRDKISSRILYKKYDAIMKFDGDEIPVHYREYLRGNGVIEYGQTDEPEENVRKVIKKINDRFIYNLNNDVNGVAYKLKRRAIFRVLGLLFQIISEILGITFLTRIFKGAPYTPCVTMGIFCGLLVFFTAYLTDRIIRD